MADKLRGIRKNDTGNIEKTGAVAGTGSVLTDFAGKCAAR